VRRAALGLAALALAPALGGCTSLSDIAGAATGTAAAAGSANPALGVAIGIGTRALADYGLRRVARSWHRTEQDAIAAVIGATPPGEARPWAVRHTLPIGEEAGEVRVLSELPTPLALCKLAAFSVGTAAARQWFLTSACRQGARWKWAAAEPATERWGSLQ
jgi:hypothetical protein